MLPPAGGDAAACAASPPANPTSIESAVVENGVPSFLDGPDGLSAPHADGRMARAKCGLRELAVLSTDENLGRVAPEGFLQASIPSLWPAVHLGSSSSWNL